MMPEPAGENIHATAVLLAGRGVLITGASGAGKSSLALELIDRQRLRGRVAALISDDRTLLRNADGILLASPHDTLAGGIEVRGAGLFAMPYEKEAALHLAVDLVPAREAVRYPDDARKTLCGIALPLLTLPSLASAEGGVVSACQAIEAALFMPRWQPPAT
jgi:serine kinase of HPr protein (carbohydrate metabolism regulator)